MGRVIAYLCVLLLAHPLAAWADGVSFNGTCATVAWNANTESDLAGYRLYDRVSLSGTPNLIATFGTQITSVPCSQLGFNAGQHYLSARAFDTSGNESPSATATEVPFVIVVDNIVSNLSVPTVNTTDVTLSFTEVACAGAPCSYDVRVQSPVISWGQAASVASGTCATPLAGTTVGATKTCTVTGLSTTTAYQFQLVPFSGTWGSNPIFGPLSNITGATTGGAPGGAGDRYTIASDGFDRLNGQLGVNWLSGYIRSSQTLPELQIESNVVEPSLLGSPSNAMAYVGASVPANHWAQISLSAFGGAGFQSVRLLLACTAPPTYTCYEMTVARNTGGAFSSKIARFSAGVSVADLASEALTSWTTNDVVRVHVRDGVLTIYRNDVSVLSVADPDPPLSGPYAGLLMGANAPDAVTATRGNNFVIGGFTVTASDVCGCDNH